MSATILQKTASYQTGLRLWIPGTVACLALLVAGCGGGTPTPEPTGTSSDSTGDSAEADPGATPMMGDPGNASPGDMLADTGDPGSNSGAAPAVEGLAGTPGAESGLATPGAAGYGVAPAVDGLAGTPGAESGLATPGAAGYGVAPAVEGLAGTPGAGAGLTTPGAPGNGVAPAVEGLAGTPGAEAGLTTPGAGFGSPGTPGAGEIPGSEGSGAGGNRQQPKAPPAGSAEYPAYHLVMGLMSGKADGLSDHISKRAKGDLAALRDGKASEKKMAELKTTFAKPELINTKRVSGGTQVNLRSGSQIINLVIKKEGDAFKVTEMKFRASSTRR